MKAKAIKVSGSSRDEKGAIRKDVNGTEAKFGPVVCTFDQPDLDLADSDLIAELTTKHKSVKSFASLVNRDHESNVGNTARAAGVNKLDEIIEAKRPLDQAAIDEIAEAVRTAAAAFDSEGKTVSRRGTSSKRYEQAATFLANLSKSNAEVLEKCKELAMLMVTASLDTHKAEVVAYATSLGWSTENES